jgi:hypothetical protein
MYYSALNHVLVKMVKNAIVQINNMAEAWMYKLQSKKKSCSEHEHNVSRTQSISEKQPLDVEAVNCSVQLTTRDRLHVAGLRLSQAWANNHSFRQAEFSHSAPDERSTYRYVLHGSNLHDTKGSKASV